MTLTTRKLKGGWAIYRGRVRYLTTLYPTKAKARARIATEYQWDSYRSHSQVSLARSA
jgi:hypothetical protein